MTHEIKPLLGRLAWSRTLLSAYPRASRTQNALGLTQVLLALRAKFADRALPRPVFLDTSRPKLTLPKPPELGSFQPPRYFSRGPIEADKSRNPTPIRYLLTESLELAVARPVPHHSALIRSLCKGKGILRQTKEGLIYLDIDDRFISTLMPYLRFQGLVKPPYFNLFGPSVGAHIPVISNREKTLHYIETVEELGTEFSFEIEGLYSLKPDTWPEVEEVWFFKVHSPELEAFRRKNLLLAKPNGHSFHIVTAIQTKKGQSPARAVPLHRVNTTYLVA